MEKNKFSNWYLILSLLPSVGLVVSFPNGGWEIICLFFIALSLLWNLCTVFESICQKNYKKALLLFVLNCLFNCVSIAIWTRYDYAVRTKNPNYITNKQEANEFGILVSEYEQVRTPVIENCKLRCDMFVVYDSWYKNIKDKSRITIDPTKVNIILTIDGREEPLMFYFGNRKYDFMDCSSELYSIAKIQHDSFQYIVGSRRNNATKQNIPDSITIEICTYNEREVIDSVIFRRKTCNEFLSGKTDLFDMSRHRSICSRIQDFFLIDELRKEVDPTDPFYANWIQSIIGVRDRVE